MHFTVTTTIITQIDVETFHPTHSTTIESSDPLPESVIYAAVEGACKATINALPGHSEDDEDDEDDES